MKLVLSAFLLAVSMLAGASAGPVTSISSDAKTFSYAGQAATDRIGDWRTKFFSGPYSKPELIAQRNSGQCMGSCAAQQGICMARCNGDGQCIGNCAAAHGICVSGCN